MIEILLVDDEVLVRTNIKLLLRGFSELHVCAEAASGNQALEMLEQHPVDVVLSDMVMPGMTGLELCQVIHTRYPKVAFVALSNYDDYALVRGTLKNGGVDYLLKHQLTADSLHQVIAKACPEQARKSSIASYSGNAILALREKFIQDLLGHMFLTREDIQYRIETLSIPLELSRVRLILMRLDRFAENPASHDEQRKRILRFSIINIGNEILQQYPNGILTHLDADRYGILLSFAGEHSDKKVTDTTAAAIHQISSNLKKYLNLSTSYSVSPVCARIEDLYTVYPETAAHFEEAFFAGDASILGLAQTRKTPLQESLRGLDAATEKEFLAALTAFDAPRAERCLEALLAEMQHHDAALKDSHMIFSDLIGILSRVCRERGLPLEKIFPGNSTPQETVLQWSSAGQARAWFHQAFTALCFQKAGVSEQTGSENVRRALAYINANYSSPLSLQETADFIGLSSGYLSVQFKKEMGQGFSDYLNALRISVAVRMIETGERDMHVIARECGFQDYAYFFRVFKKRTGKTPTEYREEGAPA